MSGPGRERFSALLGEERPDLAEANLLICAEADPRVDVAAGLARVDALAAGARAAGTVAVLREAGFHGAMDDYDDPANSFLTAVLERRRGIPIALCTLAIAVARRAGGSIEGIGLPGHFVIADLDGPGPRYIDPYNGWAPLAPADCAALVARTAGVPFQADHLRPVSERAILARTLLNLRGSYLRRGMPAQALWTVELGLVVAPGDGELSRAAVVLLTGAGRYDEAEEAAAAFLAERPDHPVAAAMETQLEMVRDLRRRMN